MNMNAVTHDAPQRLLRIEEVSHLVGLRKTAIYSGVKRNTFPAPTKIGPRVVAWPSTVIAAWIRDRIAESAAPHNREPASNSKTADPIA